MAFRLEMQVKQYVGVVTGEWCSFMVFQTGDPRYYLFNQLYPDRTLTELQFPVLKSELEPEVRRALAHGLSFSVPAYNRYKELTEDPKLF